MTRVSMAKALMLCYCFFDWTGRASGFVRVQIVLPRRCRSDYPKYRLLWRRFSRQGRHPARRRRSSAVVAATATDQNNDTPSSSSRSSGSSTAERDDLVALQRDAIAAIDEARVLSEDPLVYLVPNLLSGDECLAYRKRVEELQVAGRTMTRSNPPAVSLEASKLWPLPFLSLGAGIPPAVRTFQEDPTAGLSRLVESALPAAVAALAASVALAFGVVLPVVRSVSASQSRTSVAMALNSEEDVEFVRPLVDRVSALTGRPWWAWEAPVVTRYDPGAVFARHGDASPTAGSEWKNSGGQRIVTCICYLNTLDGDGGGGGETYFDKLDLSVSPVEGTGLVFFPANSVTWQADDRTTHESLPPSGSSEKWIVQLFGRAERVPPPLGLPETFEASSSQR